MKLAPYPSYKPSGVEWLQEVPEHWTVLALLRVTMSKCDGPFGSGLKSEHYTEVGTRVIRLSNIRFARFDRGNAAYIDSAYYLGLGDHSVQPGDVLIAGLGDDAHPVGRACVAPADLGPAMVKADCFRFRLNHIKAMPEFVAYQLSATAAALGGALSTGTTRARMNLSETAQRVLGLPPIPEQRAIADFLDRETAKIDTLVARKQTLIERLKEKRTALISRTVTRGLPPAAATQAGLDPHPNLKPSGIDWIGDVPEHWDIGKFSREVQIAEGQVDPELDPYASMILVAPNHIESGTGRLLSTETAAEQGAISGKYLCRSGEVIYSKIRPALAKAVLAPKDCLCSADMYPMASRGRLQSCYLHLMLISSQFTAWSVLEADRVAMPKVNRETLSELRVPVPPAGEQEAIADFLDHETAKIDQMTARVETAIERLQEYRGALITAAVTGKIDVRPAASCREEVA